MPSVLPTPEAAGPSPGQPGHFAHHDWLTGSVHALDNAQSTRAAQTAYASSAGQLTGVAMSAGTAGANVQTAITFPVGRFTQAPRVAGSISNAPSGSTFAVGSIRNPTTTGATVWIHNMGTASATWSGLSFDWWAVQMTSASASG